MGGREEVERKWRRRVRRTPVHDEQTHTHAVHHTHRHTARRPHTVDIRLADAPLSTAVKFCCRFGH